MSVSFIPTKRNKIRIPLPLLNLPGPSPATSGITPTPEQDPPDDESFGPPTPASFIDVQPPDRRKYEVQDPVFVPAPVITDPQVLGQIYEESHDLFQSHKITPENAFNLKFIDSLDEIIKMDTLQTAGRTLEVGTKIYSCRVEHTHSKVVSLAELVVEKGERRRRGAHGSEDDANGEALDETDYQNDSPTLDEFHNTRHRTLELNDSIDTNKNVGREEEFDLEYNIGSNQAELRRLTLKDGFDSYVHGSKKFDYSSYIFSKPVMDAKRTLDLGKNNLVPFAPAIVNISAVGHLKTLEFLRFEQGKFDPDLFDVWGNPLNVIGVDKDRNIRANILEKRRLLKEKLSSQIEGLMSQQEQGVNSQAPSEYGGFGLDAHDENPVPQEVFWQDPGPPDENGITSPNDLEIEDFHDDNYDPVDDDGQLKVVDSRNFNTLDDVDTYYDVLRKHNLLQTNAYGWDGPSFRNRTNLKRRVGGVKRKRQVSRPIDLLEIGLGPGTGRFHTTSNEETEISEQAYLENAYRKIIPNLECDTDDECEEINDAFQGFPYSKMLNYFGDRNQLILKKRQDLVEAEGIEEDGGEINDWCADNPDFAEAIGFEAGDLPIDNNGNLTNENIRQMTQEFNELGGEGDDIREEDLALLRRHKMIPEIGGLDFGSEAVENPISHFSDSGSLPLRCARQPKPINMKKVKSCVIEIWKEFLELDNSGHPTQDNPTQIDMATLLQEMLKRLDAITAKYLSTSIALIAALHVCSDLKIFMDSTTLGTSDNPMIICRGKKWKHAANIPGRDTFHFSNTGPSESSESSDEDMSPQQTSSLPKPGISTKAIPNPTLDDLMEASENEYDIPDLVNLETDEWDTSL